MPWKKDYSPNKTRICKSCKIEKISEIDFRLYEPVCKHCDYLRAKSYRERNKEKVKANVKQWHIEHKDRLKALWDRWRKENKIRVKELNEKYYRQNPEKYRLQAKIRSHARRTRTPTWADTLAIREFYKNCPKGLVVDHIIPLRGKNVCGLHIVENLQYLTFSENSKKSNKFEYED
jgi:hypothetical protein